jgi:hypothetical protein
VPMTTVTSLRQHRRSIAELPVKPNCFIVLCGGSPLLFCTMTTCRLGCDGISV